MVGVTANEPTGKLQDAQSSLTAMGANVSDVQYQGAFAFVTQKNFPQKTVLRKTTRREVAAYIKTSLTVEIAGGVKFSTLRVLRCF